MVVALVEVTMAVAITVADTTAEVITVELIPAEQPMYPDRLSAEKMAPELTVADIAAVPDQVQSEVTWMAT